MKKALLITAGLIWAAVTLTGPANADALSGGKSAIDAWITTLGGITLSNQPVSSDFPSKLKAALEKLPCTKQAHVAQVEAYIHQEDQQAPAYPQGEDRLRPKHRMLLRARKDRRPRKAGPVDDRRQGVDQRLQGLQGVGGQEARGKASEVAGVYGRRANMGGLLQSPWERRLMLQHVAQQRPVLQARGGGPLESNCDKAEDWCKSTMKQ